MTVTQLLAIYGAILSSILLGWTVYRDFTNRGWLRVEVWIGNIHGGIEDDPNDHLCYTITNVGMKTIMVTSAGGSFGERKFLVDGPSFPKKLEPGDYFIAKTSDISSVLDDTRLEYLCATDSIDKIWKVKRKNLKNVKERWSEIQRETTDET